MWVIVEIFVGILQALEALVYVGYGLRWIFSASYRAEVRARGNGDEAMHILGAILIVLAFVGLLALGFWGCKEMVSSWSAKAA